MFSLRVLFNMYIGFDRGEGGWLRSHLDEQSAIDGENKEGREGGVRRHVIGLGWAQKGGWALY